MCKKTILNLYLCANVENFALFACLPICISGVLWIDSKSADHGCGFGEFRVTHGSCRRTARNLVDSLQFPGFSGQRSETSQLNMGEFYCKMCGIHVIRRICV